MDGRRARPRCRARRRLEGSAGASARRPGEDAHAERGQADLERELGPVDARRVGDAEGSGDQGTEQCGDDADDEREPPRQVLPSRYDEAAECADDEPR
jgi:hypothetical protein